jgi:hypothetical protein
VSYNVGVPIPIETRMKASAAERVFEDFLPYLEVLDTQIGGVVQLLKDEGITTSEEFARYVVQTGRAM